MHNTIVKKSILLILFSIILSSCNGWVVQPLPYNPPTPFVLPTRTPAIYSPTPVIIAVTSVSATPVVQASSITPTFYPTSTYIPPATFTETPLNTITPTNTVSGPSLQITILGCNTSIDITHGMGEVTNAYVTLKNTGGVELTNLVATLFALDEGREHPDKIQEITSLPINYQVTLKMTADSTYQEETGVQVEVVSDQMKFAREGVESCRDIGLFAPKPEGLNTPMPSNQ